MALTVDTRTATEYGVVRTFGQTDLQFTTLGGGTYNPNTINTNAPVGSANLLDTPGGGYVAVEYLFIQFAGFTFGKSSSAYSTPVERLSGQHQLHLLGGNNTDTGVNNIQYTAQFGNGVSASIGLDDPTVWDRTIVANLSLPLNAVLGASQRLRRHACARRRRQHPRRPGLGPVPDFGRGARSQRLLQRPEHASALRLALPACRVRLRPRCRKSPVIPTPSGAVR